MIKRSDDFNVFSSLEMEKIAKIIDKKEKTKLYKSVNTTEEVELCKKQLKLAGYDCNIKKTISGYDLYAIEQDKVDFNDAMNSGNFKKLAWGRYCFERQSSYGSFNYDFDDGSVWKIIVDEDGSQVLVKEVEDDNEDKVIRNKVASKKISLNESGIKTAINILYDNVDNKFLNDILKIGISNQISSMVNNKIKERISNTIQDKLPLCCENNLNDIGNIIISSINEKHTLNNEQFVKLIDNCVCEIVKKNENLDKIFN